MLQPVQDMSHEIFWRQLMRWLVSDTPNRVVTSIARPVLYDDGHVHLRAEIRDTTYLPTSDATIQARIVGPDGSAQSVFLFLELVARRGRIGRRDGIGHHEDLATFHDGLTEADLFGEPVHVVDWPDAVRRGREIRLMRPLHASVGRQERP